MQHYDYLIVGSGLFGATFAHEANRRKKRCLVVEKRPHIGGNVFCDTIEGITVHSFGAHIFHTNDKRVWDFVNALCPFYNYTHSPLANYQGEIYNLPFNMNTFHQMWGVTTAAAAKEKITVQREQIAGEPQNLEEQAISLVGRDIYEKLVRGYTEKQWGRRCTELPAFIIKRLPVRFVYDNNYFSDRFQGIPKGGYTPLVERLLQGVDIRLCTDFLANREQLRSLADTVVYTGTIDAYFDYCYGELEYRSLRFETQVLDIEDFQSTAVVNYTDVTPPYTRIIEHKHFENGSQPKTVITREYSCGWKKGDEPYYPVNDQKNNALYKRYAALAAKERNVIFGGRLAEYKYYDMDKVIKAALAVADRVFKGEEHA